MALAAFVMTPALHAQGTPGFYVETRVTTVSKGGSGNTTARTHVERAWTSAQCSRTEGQEFLGDSTAYILETGNPARALQVRPRDRMVYTLDSAARRAIASEAAATAKLNPAQLQFKPKSLGDGGSILGHKTRKYESEITTRASAGNAEIVRAPTTMIHWVAEDPADSMVAAYRASRGRLLGAERLGNAGGLLLRSESQSQRQRDVTQVTTRDVLVWRKEVIPASRCAVPSGYRTADLLADLRAKQAATAEVQRLSRSTNPADRARAKALADSLFKEIRRTQPPPRSLRDDPRAVMIDGKATKKP
jgi:hypothetical protein